MTLKLKDLRESKGITQTFMAKQLGFKNPVSYHLIEKEERKLDIHRAKQIANILNVSIEDLFLEQ